MLHTREYNLRSGTRGGFRGQSARRAPTAMSPVRQQRRLFASAMRRSRRSRSNSVSPRRLSIGGERLVLPALQGDAYSEQTIQIAKEQAANMAKRNSGVSATLNYGRIGEVVVAQGLGRRRYAAHTGLRRVVNDALQVLLSGKQGMHLKSAIDEVYRKQHYWSTYEDGLIPLRPVPRSTYLKYVKDLQTVLETFDTNNPHATRAEREARGVQWINTLPLSADWFRFPEFYEYGH